MIETPFFRTLTRYLARLLTLTLLWQSLPWSPPTATPRPPHPPALDLPDITYLSNPRPAYASVASLRKSGPSAVAQGQTIKYTITITDDGSGTTSPHVYDVIDMRDIRDVSYSSDWWGTEHATTGQTTVEFYTDTMAAGEVATLTIVLEPNVPITDGTVITNDLYYATWDPTGRMSGTAIVTTVINAPAYEMSGMASSEPACAGTTVTYTVWLTNVGHLVTVQPFTITVELDERVSFGGASHSGTENSGLVTWGSIATPLLPGESVSRTFWVTVLPTVSNRSVLTYHLHAVNPTEVTPDGTSILTSTVRRVAADFTDTAPGCAGNPITFTIVYTDVPVTAARWYFGDGTTLTHTGSLSHTYANGGYYTVTRIVTGTCGIVSQTHAYTTVVFIDGITASFEPAATISICVGGQIHLTATSAVSSSIVGHRWDFGDGTISDTLTVTTVEHIYTAPGYYTVTLTITNATGCTDVISRPNAVFVDALSPSFAPTDTITVCLGSAAIFTDTSEVGSRATAHRWDMGDGTVITTGSVLTVAHVYLTGGYYTVTLTVTNATGCADATSHPQAVFVNGLRTDFTATTPTSICTGSGVTFSSTSVASSTITYYQWDFGDGMVDGSPAMSVTTHLYNSPGYYTVVLTITSGGCQDTLVRTDYVFVSGLDADFTPTDTITVCSGAATVTLTDTSSTSSTIVAHRWDWGDGTYTTTSSEPTATHTYTAPGYYTVTLIVTNATGCTDTISRSSAVFVNNVQASVDTTPFSILCWSGPYCGYGTGCTTTLQSTSVASGTIEEHMWDLGDGTVINTGSTPTVTHIYTQSGEFTVTLTITSAGCSDTWISPYPIVIEKVATSFEPTQTITTCIGSVIYFTDTSRVSGTVTSRVWDFGDGTSSPNMANSIHVSHTYTAAGVYTVGLALNTYSCSGMTKTIGLVVIEEATASFTNVLTSCTGVAVPFTYTGQITGAPGSYEWEWGDGTRDVTTVPTITHPYADPGVYTVRMTVTTSSGCAYATTGTVTIEGAGVSFTPDTPQRICLGTSITFSDTSIVSGTFNSRVWDFGDGITGTEAITSHLYAAPGSYTVTLTIETGSGCRATLTRTHWVTVESITAAISPAGPLTACIGQTLTFTDVSTTAGGEIAARRWDFGDGTMDDMATTTHTFDHGGTFTVTLTTTTTAGCVDKATVVVNVQGAAASFDGPTELCHQPGGITATFTNTTVYSGALASWMWEFGDGITATTWATATHNYPTPGVYTATLTVSTTNGCVSRYERRLEIDALAAAITRTPTAMICAGSSVILTDTSTVTGTVISRHWDFGDGQTITGNLSSVSHIYDAGGNYTVMLTVTTAGGCTDRVTTTVEIDHIVADFDAPKALCLGSSAHLSDTSTAAGGIVGVEWDLGDGSTATLPVTDHLYAAPGVYTVWLTATSGSGCWRAVSRLITVEAVSAAIDPGTEITICRGTEVQFTDMSTVSGTLTTREWQFGDDGSTSAESTVTHVFGTSGTYPVSLALTTSAGCADVTSVIVNVQELPVPTLTISPTSATVGEMVYFTDTGSGGASWQWDFGDGTTTGPGGTPATTHTYDTPGTYTVTLTVTSTWGCAATAQRAIDIGPAVESHAVYLPLAMRNYSIGPDLVIVNPILVTLEDGPDYVLVTIRNDGSAPAAGFWVDLYLDPTHPPETGETWPELCSQGKAWFVRRTLAPGESYTLDTRWPDDPNSPDMRYSIWPDELPEGTHTLYAVVDSYWRPYGLVTETDETNNRSEPLQFTNLPDRPTSDERSPTRAPTPPTGIATPSPRTTPIPRPTSPPTATPGP